MRKVTLPELGASGPDLSEVLQDILRDLVDRNGWSESTTAKRLGITQSMVHRILERDGAQGPTMLTLSKICAALGESPTEFFARHPDFARPGAKKPGWVRDIEESLSPSQRDRLANVIRNAARITRTSAVLDILESSVDLAEKRAEE